MNAQPALGCAVCVVRSIKTWSTDVVQAEVGSTDKVWNSSPAGQIAGQWNILKPV